MSTKQMQAALYLRLSEDKNQTGDNVADQEAGARKIANRLGADVVRVYDDNDRIASEPKRKPRPEFERMLRDAEEGQFDVLIIRHADRLYRTPYDQGRIADAFGPREIVVHQEWAGYPLDLSTPSGVLNAGIMANVALYETNHKKQRQKAKNRMVAVAGKPPEGGPVPFGFTRDPETKALTHEPKQAAMVSKAHRALLRGESLGSVIREWNKSGVTAPRGGRWTYSTVRGVLSRPLNAGLVIYDGVVLPGVKGQWKPLVSPEEHHAVLHLLGDPARRTTTGRARRHLLAGLAVCGTCSKPLKSGSTSSRGKKSVLYRCANPECSRPVYIAREQLNAEVERRFLAERGDLKEYRLISMTGHDAEALADTEARITSTTVRLGKDDADVPVLVARLTELKAERLRIKSAPARPQIESGMVRDEWTKADASGDLARKRELLLGHLSSGGLRIAPRGKISHRFDATRASIDWRPILVGAGPITFTPGDGEDLGSIPV